MNLFKFLFNRYCFYLLIMSMISNSCNDKHPMKNQPIIPKSLKGYELYSWQKGNDWFFSLVVGTNRNKSVAEICRIKKLSKM